MRPLVPVTDQGFDPVTGSRAPDGPGHCCCRSPLTECHTPIVLQPGQGSIAAWQSRLKSGPPLIPPALDQAPNHLKDRLTRWLAHKLENYRNSNRKLPTGKKKGLQYTLGTPTAHRPSPRDRHSAAHCPWRRCVMKRCYFSPGDVQWGVTLIRCATLQ